MKRVIKMDPEDNVATALEKVEIGNEVEVVSERGVVVDAFRAPQPIAFGHKIALVTIAEGSKVIKYGECIGEAIQSIKKGEHVHIHNLKSLRILIPEKVLEEVRMEWNQS